MRQSVEQLDHDLRRRDLLMEHQYPDAHQVDQRRRRSVLPARLRMARRT